jgi:1L-myo-inositol 1-phosphate cytidylyltransferase / CDP-L-myo-inositol myo-inositolphosphotransferase
MNAVYDGFISKHINRRLSEPVASLLAKTPVTPNQVTWTAFGIAIASGGLFALGLNIAGGILAQLSSIIDGVDGGLARRKRMSSQFGSLLDAVFDRYSDAAIVLGMILWSLAHETYPSVWIVGFFATVGTLAVSYTRARASSEYRSFFDRGLASIASRDIRLFLIMLGGAVGQVYFCLLLIACLTNGLVFYRLALAHHFIGERDDVPKLPSVKKSG